MEKRKLNQNSSAGITDLYEFLTALSQNNDREWFAQNKDWYERVHLFYESMVQQLIDSIATFDPRVSGLRAKDTIFRIYRDVRFSYDKSPYKRHLGAWIAPGGRKSSFSGYYFHLSPEGSVLAAGVWCPDPKLLKMLRKDIYENIEEFKSIIENPEMSCVWSGIHGDKLKTVPKEFPKDFADGDLLKFKDYYVESPIDEAFFDENWLDKATDICRRAYSFNMFIDNVVNDFLDR